MKIEAKNIKMYDASGQLIGQAESATAHVSEDVHSCQTCRYYKRPKPYEPCARCLWHGRRTRWRAKEAKECQK